MASKKKRGIIGACIVLMIPILGVAAYELWLRTALRDRPWQLESYVDNLLARGATSAGAYAFAEKLQALASQVEDAKSCLSSEDKAWAVRRDYTPCYEKLERSALTALQIRQNQEQRAQEQKARLIITLKALQSELDGDAWARKAGTKFEIRNLAQSRARTQFETARHLIELGQTESALIAIMRARAAWDQSESSISEELARFDDAANRAQWEKAAQDLLRWTRRTARTAILVDKLEHRCLLLAAGRVEKVYVVNLGRNWYRLKSQEQDASTPEGEYKVKSKLPSSGFGRALLLDYPNATDRARFIELKKAGTISGSARIGGGIEIHGGGRHNSDWTDGCVSLENAEMGDLYKSAYIGMPVTIVGTCSIGASAKK
ncbi:MAG TPA: L,D-transpeptidase [Acidobacteriota bacterium]|nr:L,D-transpeptidase [Acidobacteriota bacterium]